MEKAFVVIAATSGPFHRLRLHKVSCHGAGYSAPVRLLRAHEPTSRKHRGLICRLSSERHHIDLFQTTFKNAS